ncbi:TonB-dependent receptor plug domain-containing protein [Colwelliaceae bacterium 6441]
MTKIIKPLLILSTLFTATSHGNNLDSIFELSLAELGQLTVVTAASGFEQKSNQAPANVTVIMNEEWRAMGATTLSEVLKIVPGVHISRTFQYHHQEFVFRGLSGDASSKIKLLIDGEPMSSLQSNGLFNGFHLPLTSFKRIEVIKGPGSAVYGADAFAGIINLVSYNSDDMVSSIGGRVGSFDSYELNGRHKFSLGEAKIQFSFDYIESADDDEKIVSSDLQSTLDSVFGTKASNAPGVYDEHYQIFTANTKLQWRNASVEFFTWRNFDLGVAGGIAQALDTQGSASVHYNDYRVKYDFSEYVTGSLKSVFSYKDQDVNSFLYVFPAGTVLPIGAGGNIDFATPTTVTLFKDGYIGTPSPYGYSKTLRLTHLLNITPVHLFRWEVGYEKLAYRTRERKNFGPGILQGNEVMVDGKLTSVTNTPFIYLPNIDRNFYYLSLQDEWTLNEDVQITLGARYDHYSDFGSTINPRLGLIWQFKKDFTVKLFAGSAFQSPSISQLYAQNNPVGLGNPDLQPETVDTFESGFNVEYFIDENMFISASLYSFHAKDIVEFVLDPVKKGNVAENVGEYQGEGGDILFKWKPLDNITVNANYSYTSLENINKKRVEDIPENMAFVGVNWVMSEQWNWNISAKWIDARARAENDNRKKLAGYTWVTTKLERKNILPNLSASLIIKNALDKKAKEPSNGNIPDDYPLMGRQLLLELNYRF